MGFKDYTTSRERTSAVVFLTAFGIGFMVGLFNIGYATASGLIALAALAYLAYRGILYRPAKYALSKARSDTQ